MEKQIYNFTRVPAFNVYRNHFDNFELRFTSREGTQITIVISEKQALELSETLNQILATKG